MAVTSPTQPRKGLQVPRVIGKAGAIIKELRQERLLRKEHSDLRGPDVQVLQASGSGGLQVKEHFELGRQV